MPLIPILLLAAAAPQAAGSASVYQLNGAQVRQCATYVLDRNQRKEELAKRDAVLSADKTRLEARQKELAEMAAKVDTKKKKDVAAYNTALNAFNAEIPVNSKNIADRNAYAATIPPIEDAYTASCVKKSMNPTDVAALPDDLRLALTANTTSSTIMVPAPKPTSKRRK